MDLVEDDTRKTILVYILPYIPIIKCSPPKVGFIEKLPHLKMIFIAPTKILIFIIEAKM
jgi:hypothetical protein